MMQTLSIPQLPLKRNQTIVAFFCLFISLVCISLAALFIKVCEQEISPEATAFNRFWVTTLVLGVWNSLNNNRLRVDSDELLEDTPYDGSIFLQLVFLGVFFAADLILWSWSITKTSIANATLLANLTPMFTSLGMWLIWRKKFDNKFLMGMVIALGGACALGFDDFQVDGGKLWGDIAALMAAFSFAVYLVILEKLQTRLPAHTIVLWSSGIASVILLPIVMLDQARIFPYSWHGWLGVIGLALICQVLGQMLLVYSLNKLSSGFVAIFLLLDPILAAIGAWVFFAETLSISNWISFGVVLVGIYISLSSQSAVKDDSGVKEDITESNYRLEPVSETTG